MPLDASPVPECLRTALLKEPVEVSGVRQAVIGAWRMRFVGAIAWGVRDWGALRFEVARNEGTHRTVVTIFGACKDSALRFYVWEKLGAPSRLDVVCKEA